MSTDIEKKKKKGTAKFLKLAYNRFYELFEELIDEDFFDYEPEFRLARIRDIFAVYFEIITYQPISDSLKDYLPPFESDAEKVLQLELFKFIRNVLIHFPFFDEWDDIWFKQNLVNWNGESKSIDKFLSKYEKRSPIQFFYSVEDSERTLVTIDFPTKYTENKKIYLNQIMTEEEGVIFSALLMKDALDRNVGKVQRLNEDL